MNRDPVIWKPVGPADDSGFVPAVVRVYRLKALPNVLGELQPFPVLPGCEPLYQFSARAAHQCACDQLVKLSQVEEVS